MELVNQLKIIRSLLVLIGITNVFILITCVMAQCEPYYALILKNDVRFFLAMLPSIILVPLGICPPISKSRRMLSLYLFLAFIGIMVSLYNYVLGHLTGFL